MARAKASSPRTDAVLLAGDLTIDLSRHRVSRDGLALHLPPLSFRLLHALAVRAPAVATADELLSSVWSDRVVGNETLTQRIKLLRDALGEDASQPRYIELVRGVGYRFAGPVSLVNSDSPAPAPSSTKRRLVITSAAAALVAAIALVAAPRFTADRTASVSAQPEVAHAAYLRARFFYDRRQKGDLTESIRLFQEALQADPANAKAWIGLASSYYLEALRAQGSQKNTFIDQQRYALEQALALEADNAAANIRYGRLLMLTGEYQRGVERRLRGAAVDVMDPETLALQAGELWWFGRTREAFERQRRAAELDPLSAVAHINLSTLARTVGELDVGRRALETAERLHGETIYYEQALYAVAANDYRKALELAVKIDDPLQRCEIQLLAQQQRAIDTSAIEQARACIAAIPSFSADSVLAVAAALRGESALAWQVLDDMELAATQGDIDVGDWLNATTRLSASYELEALKLGMEYRQRLGALINTAYVRELGIQQQSPGKETLRAVSDRSTQP
ncbi:MAG: winged helix-turn-helix domain-containing protein [Pseudomonadota bacterium]